MQVNDMVDPIGPSLTCNVKFRLRCASSVLPTSSSLLTALAKSPAAKVSDSLLVHGSQVLALSNKPHPAALHAPHCFNT
jgi:hypothetical protein